jgi:hypothetical protein
MKEDVDASFPPLHSVEEMAPRFAAGFLPDDALRAQRPEWASLLALLMVRVAQLRHRKARSRNIAHLSARLAAGATAAVTTVTGGTLLAQVHGAAATALGLIAVVLGVLGAAIAAARPGESYAANLVIAARYEHLWWDLYGFGVTKLSAVSEEDFNDALSGFAKREEEISSTPDSGTK